MNIPHYLEPIVDKESIEENTFSLAIDNNKLFEVYYVGTINEIDGALHITPDYDNAKEDYPVSSILIKEKGDKPMHTVYDGLIHGYDNLFCNEHEEIEYSLKQLILDDTDLFTVTVTLGCGIDYEDEKEDFEVDDNDMVEVFNRERKISWKQVKEEGFDWLTIQLTNEKEKSVFIDEELA